MKKEIQELIEQGKWQEANQYVGENRDDFSEDDLKELENAYRSAIGSNELDEDELAKVSGGTAFSMGKSAGPKAGNINWHCNDVSVHKECNDSVSITSFCWFDDACLLVYHHYDDDGWIGGIYCDL